MRSRESVSRPLVALTRTALAGSDDDTARATARKPCEGTANTTTVASCSAVCERETGVTRSGSRTSDR